MKSRGTSLSVWSGNSSACIKIAGRANFTASHDFKSLIHRLHDKGCLHFILDLSDCLIMDSTFLGVLAGLGREFQNPAHPDPHHHMIELFNPCDRIADLLDNLGVTHLFRINQSQEVPADHMAVVTINPSEPSKHEMSKTCLEAHQVLMEVNRENIPKFKDVTEFLAEEVERTKDQDS